MEHEDFSPSSGSFRCSRAGAFAFALSSLLKSEENQEVTVRMVKRTASGEEEVRIIRETACLYLACMQQQLLQQLSILFLVPPPLTQLLLLPVLMMVALAMMKSKLID